MISVIIPAYNESATIARVLEVVYDSGIASEVIVVNDGSSDNTQEIASKFPVQLINLKLNLGKANAIREAVSIAKGKILIFLDADLIGLKKDHLYALVQPVIDNKAEMTVGQFSSGEFWTTLSQHLTPYLSGQRAVLREVILHMENYSETRFGFEIALSRFAKNQKLKVQTVELENLAHLVKERKMGFFKGFWARLIMYRQIVSALLFYQVTSKD